MAHHCWEDMLYLLDMFNGLGYSALLIFGLFWLRLVFQAVEDAWMSRRKPTHRFVHPLPSPLRSRLQKSPMSTPQPDKRSELNSIEEDRDICA